MLRIGDFEVNLDVLTQPCVCLTLFIYTEYFVNRIRNPFIRSSSPLDFDQPYPMSIGSGKRYLLAAKKSEGFNRD